MARGIMYRGSLISPPIIGPNSMPEYANEMVARLASVAIDRKSGMRPAAVMGVIEPNSHQATSPPASISAVAVHAAMPPMFCNHLARLRPTMLSNVANHSVVRQYAPL